MIIAAIVISAILLVVLVEWFFGCTHDWVFFEEIEMESMYSNKRVDVFTIYKCGICDKPRVDVSERIVSG